MDSHDGAGCSRSFTEQVGAGHLHKYGKPRKLRSNRNRQGKRRRWKHLLPFARCWSFGLLHSPSFFRTLKFRVSWRRPAGRRTMCWWIESRWRLAPHGLPLSTIGMSVAATHRLLQAVNPTVLVKRVIGVPGDRIHLRNWRRLPQRAAAARAAGGH